MKVLGIDIGGSGMKGGLVDLESGEMMSERYRIPTPASRKPEDMAKVFGDIVKHFDYKGPIGCGFPTIIKHGVCKSVSNLNKGWLNLDTQKLFSEACGQPVTVINDADAAGYAVMKYGIGKNEAGFVLMITIGTGIGSGAFFNGTLIPNFELGQIPYKKYKKIEHFAADSIRKNKNLSYKEFGKRVNIFLEYVDILVCPDLIILGGGVSKHFDKFEKEIKIETPVKPAILGNHAGIIGAAAAISN